MTSVSSRPAPFLKFGDSLPSWTIDDHNSSGQSTTDDQTTESLSTLAHSSSLRTDSFNQENSSCGTESPRSLGYPPHPSEHQRHSVNDQSQFIQEAQHLQHVRNCEDQILADFQDKKVYLFLDYDGTLTNIVSQPENAVLSDHMRQILFNLANSDRVTVGIVTGRALSSVKRFVQISATEQLKFLYAASHGFHIEAAGQQLHHQVGARYIPILRDAALKISEALGHIQGVTLEDNEFAVSVHYRNVPPEFAGEVESRIDTILESYPSLKKTKGKMVFELRINLVWDKGRAVSWLLQAMNVDPKDPNVRLVYIGDDLTDEDAFRVIRQCGGDHLAILVSDHYQDRDNEQQTLKCQQAHRPTSASLFVNDPHEVAEFLTSLQRITSSSSSRTTSGSDLTLFEP